MIKRRVENRRFVTVFVLVLALVLALLATVVVSKSAQAQPGRPGPGYWISSSRPTQSDFGGGPGGQQFSDARCKPGSVATGFHVQIGKYFNLVWVDCAVLRPNGALDRNVRSTSQAGSPGGNDVRDAQCPFGQGLIGLQGRTGGSIDVAVGVCADPREVADRRNPRTQLTNSIAIPSPHGQPAQAPCQVNQVMVGIRAKSGQWIDHLWVLCSDIQRR